MSRLTILKAKVTYAGFLDFLAGKEPEPFIIT